jgi:lantibiotic modifying enzyme
MDIPGIVLAGFDWTPLLDAARAARAREVALEIATALEQRAPEHLVGLKGDASIAILLAQAGRDSAAAKLDSALAVASAQPLTLSLFGGLSGISWVLSELGAGDEVDLVLAHFDSALVRYLDVPRWAERYDLMSGLAGVGVYAAERRDAVGHQLAEHVIHHLETSATMAGAGTAWRTPPAFLPEPRRARFPDGTIDLGVAHGVPGIIGMLARFIEVDLEAARSRRLLDAAVTWLLEAAPPGAPRFGSSWPVDLDEPKRIGWCYGDVGVAGVLLKCSRVLGSPRLQAEALELLTQSSAALDHQGVPDAAFCHGAASIAHVYNIAFQQTGSLAMRGEAIRWIDKVLALQASLIGIAGYVSFKPSRQRWEADPTLLSGVTGIGLVLLAAIEDREPAWQRLFVL